MNESLGDLDKNGILSSVHSWTSLDCNTLQQQILWQEMKPAAWWALSKLWLNVKNNEQ